MINLIKNELIKLWYKRVFLVLIILSLIITILTSISSKIISDSITYSGDWTEDAYNEFKTWATTDLKEGDKEGYINNMATYELHQSALKYDKQSWQYYIITNQGLEMQHNIVRYRDIEKNNDNYVLYTNQMDEFLKLVDNVDYDYFIKLDISDIDKEIQNNKKMLSEKLSKSEIKKINKNIENLEFDKYILNYRLENKIPQAFNEESYNVDYVVNTYYSYAEMDKYASKESIEAAKHEYEVEKYKLEHGIVNEYDGAADSLRESMKQDLSLVIISIFLGALIIAAEFNKGTIKQLLLRPFSRSKILISKLIAALIVFIISFLLLNVSRYFIYGFVYGFDTYFVPVAVYDVTKGMVIETSFYANCLLQFFANIFIYFIVFGMSLCISVFVGSESISIVAPLFIYFFSLLNEFLVPAKYAKYFPFTCWKNSDYLYGGINEVYKYNTLVGNLTVSIVTFAVLLIISFVVFKFKDIKNQ